MDPVENKGNVGKILEEMNKLDREAQRKGSLYLDLLHRARETKREIRVIEERISKLRREI